MLRKKQNPGTKLRLASTPAVVSPKKTSKLLIAVVILIVLLILWFFWSMLRFFLPVGMVTLPFFSMMGDKASEINIPGLSGLKAPADYQISQVDDYPVSMSVTVPFFNLTSRGNFNIVSQGLPVSLARPGDPDWKTEWRVYQDIVYDADLEGGVYMEERQGARYFLVDIPGRGIKARSSGQTVLSFSLSGVKESGTFPVKIEYSDANAQMESAQQDTRFINRDPEGGTNWNIRGEVDYNKTDTYAGKTVSATGKLIKDNGKTGAEITLGTMDMPQAYKDAALKARDIARQYNAPGGLQNLYDDSGRINNQSGIASMDSVSEKPLRIFLNSGE
ncbi:MAG: hypothetical protein FJZ04_00135 [Candidatus Moranbacteria bacterium]|nr:hypothetical protein [Candidatus Moranbacteria bacterium]